MRITTCGYYNQLASRTYVNDSLDLSAHDIEDNSKKSKVIRTFNKQGFVIVQAGMQEDSAEKVLRISDWLNLGRPFSPHYMNVVPEIQRHQGINRVAAMKGGTHTAFTTQAESPFHTDGTLQPIGKVQTSVIYCEEKATEGGRNTFFNVAGAYGELRVHDAEAAAALFDPKALTRQAVDTDHPEIHTGPVLQEAGGDLFSRFSIDHVSTWNVDKVRSLQVALDFMIEKSQPGSPWYTEVDLKETQAVVLANSLIAHGRTKYQGPRVMWRGLFERRPS